jgi:hypothetical protein
VCNGSVKTARVDDEGCQRTGTSLRTVEESTQKQAYLRR